MLCVSSYFYNNMSIQDIFENKKLVIFDIDGTLSDKLSWYNITSDLGGSIKRHEEIFIQMLKKEIDLETAISLLSTHWKETGNAKKDYFQSMFKNWNLRSNAKYVVSKLQERYKICIITGSNDLYAKTVAEKLNVENFFANTKLVFDKDDYLKTFKYNIEGGQKKLQQLNTFLASEGLRYEDCVAVGDGENDIEIFKHVDGIYFDESVDVGLMSYSKASIKSLDQLIDWIKE